MGFKVNTAMKRILQMKSRIKVVKGGTYAGKTYCILAYLIDKAAREKGIKITVIAETIPAIKQGSMSQFQEIMQSTERWVQERWNATERKYTFHHGSQIQFNSYDSLGKAKQAGKRQVLFINEANYIPLSIADALMTRTTDEVIIDYNPDNEFWVDEEIIPREDCDTLVLTYLDNEYTPQKIVEDLEHKLERAKTSEYWRNWCDVYIFGKTGNLEGQVYDDWKIIDVIPEGAKYIGTGLDFGFTGDPTAIVDGYQLGDQLFFNEIAYQKELGTSKLANIINQKRRTVYADHAPQIISDLNMYGCEVLSAKKSKVVEGISQLKDFECFITSNSINAIKEKKHYIWAVDKTGKRTGEPIDAWNHFFDACRYLVNSYSRTNKKIDNHGNPFSTHSRKDESGFDSAPWTATDDGIEDESFL